MSAARREDFRPEIEGLRALAVLAVLLHHAFPALLPGGFIGVDIFFVVSGHVIGRGLLRAFANGEFRFTAFWARRARRIFPALVLVLLVSWGLGSLLLTPAEFASLGRQMLAAALFGNNLLLAQGGGYFEPAAASQPLLHLWSLGVEEQFYLLAPCLLWLGVATGGRAMSWVYRAGAASLVWTLGFSQLDEVGSFYLLHTRFWELGAGLALAHWQHRASVAQAPAAAVQVLAPPGRRESQGLLLALAFVTVLQILATPATSGPTRWMSIGGLLMLLLAALLALHRLDGSGARAGTLLSGGLRRHGTAAGLFILCAACLLVTPQAWPGAATVWPVLGAVLVMGGQAAGAASRLLSSRAALFFGRISYPLYLWHWPLLVCLRMLQPEPTAPALAGVLALSLLLAWLTERWLEQPMRFGRWGARRFPRPPARWAALALVGVGGLGLATELGKGLGSRAPAGLVALAEWSEPDIWRRYRVGECFHFLNNEGNFGPACTPARQAGKPWVLLWGDSHAAHLYPGMEPWAQARGLELAQWTTGSCPPTWLRLRAEGPACPRKMAQAEAGLRMHRPDVVVLAAAWGSYLEANSEAQIVAAAVDSLARLRAMGVRNIVLFGPGPRWNTSLPADLYRHMLRNRTQPLPQRLATVGAGLGALDAALSAMAREQGVAYVSVLQALCNDDGCRTVVDASLPRPDLSYWDRDHLTVSGSVLLVGQATAVLDAALTRSSAP